MKYASVIALLALAATAIATPTPWSGGGGGGGSSSCNNNQQEVCCASILDLICLVDVIGGSCDSSAYCCDNGASVVSYLSLFYEQIISSELADTDSLNPGRFDQSQPIELCSDPLNNGYLRYAGLNLLQQRHFTCLDRFGMSNM
jgi:hypothetical protein